MAEIKTKVNNVNPRDFISSVSDEKKRKDAFALLDIFEEVTGEKPCMWGTSIIGFGKYHYKSDKSAQEGDWPLVAFSPRKQNLTLYVMPGFSELKDLLSRLGKHKVSVGCLYINKLEDVDPKVLKEIIKKSFKEMKKKHKA